MKRVLLLILWLPLLLPAENSENPSSDLEQLNRQISELNGKIEACKQEKTTLLGQIYRLELMAESTTVGFNRTTLLLQETRKEIAVKAAEQKRLTDSIARSRGQMRRVLRVLYKAGGEGTLRVLLNVRDFQQLFTNFHLINRLLDADFDQIRQMKGAMAQLAQVERELRTKETRLATLRGEQQRQVTELRRVRAEKLQVIHRINRERQSFLQYLDELRDQAERLDQIVHQRTVPDRLGDMGEARGQLRWPLRGEIIAQFGRKKSARFNTYVLHNGIEIRPTGDGEVRAVWDGEVIYADYLQGYGNLLIVQHGRNYHTLYGRLESFLKHKGERVARGEPIAVAGATGSTSGRSLYFEVRANLKSEDPLKWLGKR